LLSAATAASPSESNRARPPGPRRRPPPPLLPLLRRHRPPHGTSANITGREECDTAAEIRAQLGDSVDLILDTPVAATGQPSTIVDCTTTPPQILRPGAIPEDSVRAALARTQSDGQYGG
jgi:tRNA A37 threonylcarbamoyladenosine synthetase subunit TsaC/SUA5/YrdC